MGPRCRIHWLKRSTLRVAITARQPARASRGCSLGGRGIELDESRGSETGAAQRGAQSRSERVALETGDLILGRADRACTGRAEAGVGEVLEGDCASASAWAKRSSWTSLPRRRMELRQPRGAGRGSAVVSGNHGARAARIAGSARISRNRSSWPDGWRDETTSPLARAWLTIALRLHGVEPPARARLPLSDDILITAIEALGAPGGNSIFLKREAGVETSLGAISFRSPAPACWPDTPALRARKPKPRPIAGTVAGRGGESSVLFGRSGEANARRHPRNAASTCAARACC